MRSSTEMRLSASSLRTAIVTDLAFGEVRLHLPAFGLDLAPAGTAFSTRSVARTLTAGSHAVVLEFYEFYGLAQIDLGRVRCDGRSHVGSVKCRL